MIAGLPMYDRPELFEAHNKLWQLVHEQIVESPKLLSRNISPWNLWTSPKLLLAQTCSSPYRNTLHKTTFYVGTADYNLPNCPPGYYNSLIIGRPGYELSEGTKGTFGYNEKTSHSGWTAPMAHFRNLNIFPKFFVETGSHRASVKAVAQGKINLRKNLFNAIRQAVRNLQKQYRSVLYLNDFVTIDKNKYLSFQS